MIDIRGNISRLIVIYPVRHRGIPLGQNSVTNSSEAEGIIEYHYSPNYEGHVGVERLDITGHAFIFTNPDIGSAVPLRDVIAYYGEKEVISFLSKFKPTFTENWLVKKPENPTAPNNIKDVKGERLS